MLKTIARYFSKVAKLARSGGELPQETALAALYAKRRPLGLPGKDAPRVAVGACPDLLYYAIFAEVVNALRDRGDIQVEQLVTLGFRPGAAHSLRGFLRAQLQYGRRWHRKWERMFSAFCDRTGYRALSWHAPWAEVHYWIEAFRLWRRLESKEQLVAMRHQGILIGDLVADTYLRLRPSPFINLKDPYLAVVIRQALKDLRTAFAYFRRRQPRLYLTCYTTYVQHGVPARVAVSLGVHTRAFGNHQEFASEITPEHPYHTKRADNYDRDFQALPGQAEKLARAKTALQARLSGRRDNATAYMRASAYEIRTDHVPDVKDTAVIFLHDFYDSAHVYRWMVFHDFWEWVCTSIETLDAAGIPFYVKPHPNQAEQSNLEIARLRARYPKLRVLPSEVSNTQLIAGGMRCAVTVYGSVAAEMAYMGIPSISCSDSPHASFDAFAVARSKDEYRELLRGIPILNPDRARLKTQACAHYVMHNANLDSEAEDVRDKYITAWAGLARLGDESLGAQPRIEAVLPALAALCASPGFKRYVQDWTALLRSQSTRLDQVEDLQCSRMLQS